MERFPQELVDQICSYLSAEDLSSCYYLSTKFRAAAEDQAGQYHRESWEINSANKQDFCSRFSGFRLRYLWRVNFKPYFADPGGKDYLDCVESVEERQEKDKFFTAQIQDLFATLKMVEERAGERNRGNYRLRIYSPFQGGQVELCVHRRHPYWRTHLLEPATLPSLLSVRSFQIVDNYAKLDYRVLVDFIMRFPNMEKYIWYTGKDEWTPELEDKPASLCAWDYIGPRRDARHDFGKAVTAEYAPKTFQCAKLDFLNRISNPSHWTHMPDLVSPASKDPFSTSLHILSYHLVELTLRAQVDEAFFWPDDGSIPTWPNLTGLYVSFHIVAPSGAWYFEGPRGEGRDSTGYQITQSCYPPPTFDDVEYVDDPMQDDWNCQQMSWHRSFEFGGSDFSFRISPNDSLLSPLLASFAKAAANMPKLKQAVVWCPLQFDLDYGSFEDREPFEYYDVPCNEYRYTDYLAWGFAYFCPRNGYAFATNPGDPDCDARQIWWKVGKWRPSPEVHGLFRQIGRQKYGDALKEYWDDDRYGQNLVTEHCFTSWMGDKFCR